ncbi:hypothetical protein PE066_20400 [Ramlibacter tataouinensis]|uniref:hypothetical protein n=1 Tax=Ramlibacter tataouinensis TaxID=94132 RepID=UPI0022F3A717|nr:hypothetical protein [Ramlibacter tataouinensis]WBY01781.1 hypothetical protein PE066_20400 [Ramlibacter tataouinensis]
MKHKRWGAELPPTSPPGGGASGLVRQLIGKLRARPRADRDLAPPGQRSGEGADSIGPYLRQSRNSRPAPLE